MKTGVYYFQSLHIVFRVIILVTVMCGVVGCSNNAESIPDHGAIYQEGLKKLQDEQLTAAGFESAILLLKEAASAGNSEAMDHLASVLEHGHKDFEPRPEEYFRFFSAQVNANILQAQVKLGRAYESGIGTTPDWVQAAHWYRKAATAGHPRAMFYYGNMLCQGKGVIPDCKSGKKWLLSAIRHGVDDAKWNYSFRLVKEAKSEDDFKTAFRWMREAAEAGSSNAAYRLAKESLVGKLIPLSIGDSRAWFRKFIEVESSWRSDLAELYLDNGKLENLRRRALEGDSLSQYKLGIFLISAIGDFRQKKEGILFLQDAAAQGEVGAIYELMGRYLTDMQHTPKGASLQHLMDISKKNSSEPVPYKILVVEAEVPSTPEQMKLVVVQLNDTPSWRDIHGEYMFFETPYNQISGENFETIDAGQYVSYVQEAAEAGMMAAQQWLANAYLLHSDDADQNEGIKWATFALDQDSVIAAYLLGVHHCTGEGVTLDCQYGFSLLERSSAQGYSEADLVMGLLLLNGTDVRLDVKRGEKLLVKAAEKIPRAMYELAKLYAYGSETTRIDVKLDIDRAVVYLKRAISENHPESTLLMGTILLEGQLLEANRKEGLALIKNAAELGSDIAMLNYGLILVKGELVPQDFEEAGMWFEEAVERNNAMAMLSLGLLHVQQSLQDSNQRRGYLLIKRAAELDYEPAYEAMQELNALFPENYFE